MAINIPSSVGLRLPVAGIPGVGVVMRYRVDSVSGNVDSTRGALVGVGFFDVSRLAVLYPKAAEVFTLHSTPHNLHSTPYSLHPRR